MDRFRSVLASADAIFNFSKDADAVVVLHLITKQSVIVDVGTRFLMTRFLCTLSLIFCSNEQVVDVGFGGEFGHRLVTKRRINSRQGVRSDSGGYKRSQLYFGATNQGLVSYILLLVRSLRTSEHGFYILWQR